MEQHENHITLIGVMTTPPEFSHSNHGRHFYRFPLEVTRLSGAVDVLQILASESLLRRSEIGEGTALCVMGQIRSYNSRSSDGRHLIISVLADTIEPTELPHDNRVTLRGTICKEPVYRRTPLGREICDVMLAVNRSYHRADYLPCILWGSKAREASYYAVGTDLFLTGRLQSRTYIKVIGEESQERTAYEISTITAEPEEG